MVYYVLMVFIRLLLLFNIGVLCFLVRLNDFIGVLLFACKCFKLCLLMFIVFFSFLCLLPLLC